MRTIVSIFKNRTSFSQELWDEFNTIMKSPKCFWPWGLGPRNYIWATWAQKIYLAISPEPWFQFWQTSFSQESWDESNKIMKLPKSYWTWGLGPKNYIWATWAQKTYPTISPQPWLQFSQTRPHFLKNHEMNPIKSWNLKKVINLGAWGLETTLEPLGPRRCVKP